MIPEQYLSQNSKKFDGPMILIWGAFTLIMLGVILSGISGLTQPPDSDNYSALGYQEAYEDYEDRKFTFDGLSTLLMTTGTIALAAGLLSLSVFSSERFPQWVRVALMAGTMLFLVGLFTPSDHSHVLSDISDLYLYD